MDLTKQAKEYGQMRVAFAKNAKTEEDWAQWAKPQNPFAFKWGPCWNNTIEYKVADFEAEVGFFIDVLGCDCNTIMDGYAMIMGPEKDFFFSVRRPKDDENVTPSDAISIEFMIQDMAKTCESLKSRGIEFTEDVQSDAPGSPMKIASFKTPHGIKIKLWSFEPEKAH